MRFFIFFASCCLSFISFVVNGQEYYRSILFKPDSAAQGTRLFLGRLQMLSQPQSAETERLYRDSLAAVLISSDPVFANGNNTTSPALDTLLPRPSFRLINDLLWLNFKLSSDKAGALSLLQVLGRYYPAEEFIQSNLSLAYSLTGQRDSSKAVANRYLQIKPEGYNSLHLARSILDNGDERNLNGETGLKKIINLGADSFRLFNENKLYQFPANLDSLRNALANVIIHRAGVIKAPDKVTGRLILDFADLTVKDKLYSESLPFYDIATIYDPGMQPAVAERKTIIAEAEKSVTDTFKWASIFYAIPLLSFVLILISWLRSKRKSTKAA